MQFYSTNQELSYLTKTVHRLKTFKNVQHFQRVVEQERNYLLPCRLQLQSNSFEVRFFRAFQFLLAKPRRPPRCPRCPKLLTAGAGPAGVGAAAFTSLAGATGAASGNLAVPSYFTSAT